MPDKAGNSFRSPFLVWSCSSVGTPPASVAVRCPDTSAADVSGPSFWPWSRRLGKASPAGPVRRRTASRSHRYRRCGPGWSDLWHSGTGTAAPAAPGTPSGRRSARRTLPASEPGAAPEDRPLHLPSADQIQRKWVL